MHLYLILVAFSLLARACRHGRRCYEDDRRHRWHMHCSLLPHPPSPPFLPLPATKANRPKPKANSIAIARQQAYLHTDGDSFMLSLTANARNLPGYHRFHLYKPAFCVSPNRTPTTPTPVYVYRYRKGDGRWDHLYTTDEREVDSLQAGSANAQWASLVDGWRVVGVLGYVSKKDKPGLVPVFRWYSPYINQHLVSRDKKKGMKMNMGFVPQGILGYTVSC